MNDYAGRFLSKDCRLTHRYGRPLSLWLITNKLSRMDIQHDQVQPPVVEEFLERAMSLDDTSDYGGKAFDDKSQAHRFMHPDHLERQAGAKVALGSRHHPHEPAHIVQYLGPTPVAHIVDT